MLSSIDMPLITHYTNIKINIRKSFYNYVNDTMYKLKYHDITTRNEIRTVQSRWLQLPVWPLVKQIISLRLIFHYIVKLFF